MNNLQNETIAYFYDDECGTLVRALFAGLDTEDKPQWVNITPGYDPQTLNEMSRIDGYGTWLMLAMEGEKISPRQLTKVLLSVMNNPGMGVIEKELHEVVHQLEQFGVRIATQDILSLNVEIYRSEKFGSTKGERNHFMVHTTNPDRLLGGVDEFDVLSDIISWLKTLFDALRAAGVSLSTKLIVSNKLEKQLQDECPCYAIFFDKITITKEL